MRPFLNICCLISMAIFAQNRDIVPAPPIPRPMPEPILVKLPPEVQCQPIEVTDVEILAAVNGIHAETTMTLTFFNPNNRVLEGELYFPLPTDATISGYALDINGAMVDGVIVEKQKARVVFEEVVRQGVDPGLVEQAAGNVFKTRIYPLPARGSRKIRVKYVSLVDIINEDGNLATYYNQPLRFDKPLRNFKIRVEVAAAAKAPEVKTGSLANFSFGSWRNIYAAETELKDIALSEDLRIALMTAPTQSAVVEKAPDSQTYFAANALVDMNTILERIDMVPRHPTTVLWDASASRAKTDHDAEFAFLQAVLPKNTTLSLVVFRDKPEKPQTFNSPETLIAAINAAPFDGASNLVSALQATADDTNILLCSDGVNNYGPELSTLNIGKREINAIFQDRDQNIAVLRRLAQRTGGQVLDLRKLSLEDAKKSFQSLTLAITAAKLDGRDISNDCQTQVESGRLAVAGLLPDGQHKLEISFNLAETMTFNLNSADAQPGTVLRTNYGQMLIANLLADNAPEDVVTAQGQTFGLVTPNTSLMVLDSLNQYVRYHIRPPESLPEMRREYDQAIASEGKKQQPEPGQLISNDMKHVQQIWDALVSWHKTRNFAAAGNVPPERREQAAFNSRPGVFRRMLNAVSGMNVHQAQARATAAVEEDLVDGAAPAPEPAREALLKEAEGAPAPTEAARAATPKASATPAPQTARTTIKAWSSNAPYLDDLKSSGKNAYATYLKLKDTYGEEAGFYMDCADFFMKEIKDKALAVTVISNLAELQLENREVLRVLGYQLRFLGEYDAAEQVLRKVLAMAPEEPQSYRDLALVLDELNKFQEAVDMLLMVVNHKFNGRFPEIENIALNEINRIIARAKRQGMEIKGVPENFIHLVDTDIRVVISWDTDMTDMDLWVTDPFKEKCFYGHRFTATGGRNSPDFTQGYGPEEFMIRNAKKGNYLIQTDYYGSHSQKVLGPVTLYAEIFTDYGRATETHQVLSFRLGSRKEVVEVATISHTGENKPFPHDAPFDYQIKKGDTLESIAIQQLGDKQRIDDILKLNPALKADQKLPVGTIIKLPATK